MSALETCSRAVGYQEKRDDCSPAPPSIITPNLFAEIMRGWTLPLHSPHGPAHWVRVEANALRIAPSTGADLTVCIWFAWLHDCRRVDDYSDLAHGSRAATFAQCLLADQLDALKLRTLTAAIELHTLGMTNGDDPTLATCWDADRLDLKRFMSTINPERMSTPFGKALAMDKRR